MRYIIRKFVDAATVSEALRKEPETPVHDVYLKEGEEPHKGDSYVNAVGFYCQPESDLMPLEMGTSRKKR